jgi:hypothetical protein
LALQWNRVDIAKAEIFNGEELFTINQLNKLLELALIENKPDFVELLLTNGANLSTFLTYGRLYYLYNSHTILNDSKRAPLFEIYKMKYKSDNNDKIFITFKKLRHLLKRFTNEEMKFEFLPKDPDLIYQKDDPQADRKRKEEEFEEDQEQNIESQIKSYLEETYNKENTVKNKRCKLYFFCLLNSSSLY